MYMEELGHDLGHIIACSLALRTHNYDGVISPIRGVGQDIIGVVHGDTGGSLDGHRQLPERKRDGMSSVEMALKIR